MSNRWIHTRELINVRALWCEGIGWFLQRAIESETTRAWVIESDEGYCAGYYRDGRGVVNSTIGRIGYSLREPLNQVLTELFAQADAPVTVQDLGDLPGGHSTEGE